MAAPPLASALALAFASRAFATCRLRSRRPSPIARPLAPLCARCWMYIQLGARGHMAAAAQGERGPRMAHGGGGAAAAARSTGGATLR